MNQNQDILKYLKKGKAITPLDALFMFGSFRLGARIWDLRQLGYNIEMKMIKVPSGKHIASYKLKGKK